MTLSIAIQSSAHNFLPLAVAFAEFHPTANHFAASPFIRNHAEILARVLPQHGLSRSNLTESAIAALECVVLEGKIESQIARENLQGGANQRRQNMEDAWSGSGLCRPFFK